MHVHAQWFVAGKAQLLVMLGLCDSLLVSAILFPPPLDTGRLGGDSWPLPAPNFENVFENRGMVT